MRKFIAEILLSIVTIIWGIAFVWQSLASKALEPLSVVGFRSIIAVIAIGAVALLFPTLYKTQEPKIKIKKVKYSSLLWSLLCGIVLFLAMYIQQIGLAMTTAGKAGFITVLYICLVPLIGVFLGEKLNKYFIVGLILAVIGFYLLSVKEEFTFETGDLIVFISAFLFGAHIIIIGYATVRVNSMLLSINQLIVVSVLSLSLAIFKENITPDAVISVAAPLLALGVLSSAVGYTLQIISQRDIPAHTASLIMSLESVVAAIAGVIILGEHIGLREVLGMVIVFIGIIISQKKDKKIEN
ncbi:putative membrane protein [Gemella bergeri ATCC 700627]|uniref:Putative membrane protein n=1 Tax=Gemella bergeri ATCC 700627 TaxID=1321820 RepID=U2S0V6_9BACL|nr:DMT family transporter [Gemella bergeri]ERK56442.1 putative membrane protein [Gemella bergeri ATCC 700627]